MTIAPHWIQVGERTAHRTIGRLLAGVVPVGLSIVGIGYTDVRTVDLVCSAPATSIEQDIVAGERKTNVPGCGADNLPVPHLGWAPTPGEMPLAMEVRVLYFVPSGLVPDPNQQARILQASRDVHRWYADHTDRGRTFFWGGTVETVAGSRPPADYQVDPWGSVLSELSGRGYPIWAPGVVFSIWTRECGLFALGATWYAWTGVGMVSMESFIQDGCVPTHPSNWPCTPAGAMAHELGHAFGLPHPDTVGGWNGDYLNDNSLMGSHWNFPERDPRTWVPDSPWGLLNYERDHLRYDPVVGMAGSPYPALPAGPLEMPDLPSPPLTLDIGSAGAGATSLSWNDMGSAQYHAYWSTSPWMQPYAAVSCSPTTGGGLTHLDGGEPLIFFKVFEIGLSQ
ncbi:MAG: M66 family metalloprotease [Candidatus Polarisedimenticolia bacterium]